MPGSVAGFGEYRRQGRVATIDARPSSAVSDESAQWQVQVRQGLAQTFCTLQRRDAPTHRV